MMIYHALRRNALLRVASRRNASRQPALNFPPQRRALPRVATRSDTPPRTTSHQPIQITIATPLGAAHLRCDALQSIATAKKDSTAHRIASLHPAVLCCAPSRIAAAKRKVNFLRRAPPRYAFLRTALRRVASHQPRKDFKTVRRSALLLDATRHNAAPRMAKAPAFNINP